MLTRKTKLPLLIALMLCMGVVFMCGTAGAFAAEPTPTPAAEVETLSVDEVWLAGDTLHIAVTDKDTGVNQTLELSLKEYAKPGDELVTVQASDREGNLSNAIQFKNPYYVAQEGSIATAAAAATTTANDGAEADAAATQDEKPAATSDSTTESAIPNGANAFTPDGTGQVVDNATDKDGKEFFSIKTDDGNVFYLIVDRARTNDNVYLLNAVSEKDLASLAKDGDGLAESAVPTVAPTVEATPEPTPAATTAAPTQAPKTSGGGNTGMMAFVAVAVLAIGGAGYYFKILRPKQLAAQNGDDGSYAEDYGDDGDGYETDEDDELEYGHDDSDKEGDV
jgi:hypothetical protein